MHICNMVRTEVAVSGLQNVQGTKQGWYYDVNDLQACCTLTQGRHQVVMVGWGRQGGGG